MPEKQEQTKKNEKLSPHLKGVFQALFVTLLWSSSWVIIKFGLKDIPALTFAGLRYSLAFLCLLPLALFRTSPAEWKQLSRRDWVNLAVLGVIFYSITQGAQFLALAYLPAVTTSLLLNFTSVLVALMGIFLLSEKLNWMQWGGVLINLVGVVVYFYPVDLPNNQIIGIVIALVGVAANAGAAILGRYINRGGRISPLQVTTVSMGIGAGLLLGTGISIEGFPPLNLSNWLSIAWLAVVNTALAFTLWNRSMQVLSAVESSIINSTMLIQIAILAWIFLGERISLQEAFGMLLAAAGVMIVQMRNGKKKV